MINLDANASYGLLPEVSETLRSWDPRLLNPSSIHQGGQSARAAIEEARSELVALLDLNRGDRVIFTSGATEANNMALNLLTAHTPEAGSDGPDLITTTVEHPSVLEPARDLLRRGYKVAFIRPSERRMLEVGAFEEAVTSNTRLCSVMLANNETGHVFPVSKIVEALRSRYSGIFVHSDAVQALGKIEFSFKQSGLDLCSISAHKIGGLPGAGALIVSERVEHYSLIKGGPQELRWRAGTENVLGIVSLGIAAAVIRRDGARRRAAMLRSRQRLLERLREEIPSITVNTPEDGLPNTLHITIPGLRADDLIVALDVQGLLASSGAACASGKPEPSHVLLAFGMSPETARASMRLSVRAEESEEHIDMAAHIIATAVSKMSVH